MHCITQARVVSFKEPVAFGRFKFFPVRESECLAVAIAELPRQPLDVGFCDRLFGEELFQRA